MRRLTGAVRHFPNVAVCLTALVLAACGGGGGDAAPVAAGDSAAATVHAAAPGSTATALPVIAIAGDDAARLADQATFGANAALLAAIGQQGSGWIDAQLRLAPTGYPALPAVSVDSSVTCPASLPAANTCWRDHYTAFPLQRAFYQNAVSAPDQLRQRVALALSQIFVVSSQQVKPAYAMREYQQMLLKDAFGNYRQLLQDVTLSPAMGTYLNMANNNKGDPAKGIAPNENYAREVLQLFSIGVNRLNADGTTMLQNGSPVPAYSQDTIEGFAAAFTGWTYPTAPGLTAKANNPPYYLGQMMPVTAEHDTGTKLLLDGAILPAGQTPQVDLQQALDDIFHHPNVGPFIGRQLIQFLVTSNPSPAYVARVSAVFANDGTGTRGNLAAVVRAILLDAEARGAKPYSAASGKLREPAVDIPGILRALGGTTDGVYPLEVASALGEPLFEADTVFSFYPPSYPLPGSASLQAPQFGIANTATAVARLNFLSALLYSTSGIAPQANVPGATGTQVNVASLLSLAPQPATLVQQLNASLLHHTLTSGETQAITNAVAAVPATDSQGRVRAALYLVLASPRYQITR